MIINIRGTSGSGKSHLVRSVMSNCLNRVAVFVEGRKRPLYYTMQQPNGKTLAVIGHYETPCGGCDTIPSMDRIYDTVKYCDDKGWDVLYEGLLISAEVNRAVELGKLVNLVVIELKLPLQECIDSVNARRWAKNPDKPGVNPKNTEAKWKQTSRSIERIGDAGVECHTLNRTDAFKAITRVLWA